MRAIGIILAGGDNNRMRELSNRRTVAAMPIAGSFRAIDFALSNMSNSRIKKVAVLTQYNARSLNEHLSSSKWWDFGSKQGGLYVFPPAVNNFTNKWWYSGDADAIYQNLAYLRNNHEPYVVIASADGICKIDFESLLEYHLEKGADITLVCARGTEEEESRFGTVKMDDADRITEIGPAPTGSEGGYVPTGIYIIRRRLLIELLQKCIAAGGTDIVKDILIKFADVKKIYGFRLNSYWRSMSTVESYYHTNMDFLEPEVRDFFFRQYPNIYSKQSDNPPAKFNDGSTVKNSLISSGSVINGTVENSLIFKKVFVGKNCIIRNSIVLNDVYIGDNSHIENCIVESRNNLRPDSDYRGTDEIKIVIEKN
ncbi:MAG TPA: glucose-1-phosphate adenylyltransferase subunit GlgD [Lachnospiraceae bacterium]|jgi:glucose-1-phosphate adenylyltransferase|nr:glucose-1-phosphate adenylyltransferase subunit GlgD [Lachnospiraceae bacterium]